MAFETKEQILEKILAQEKPKCPHCGIEMKLGKSHLFPWAMALDGASPTFFAAGK